MNTTPTKEILIGGKKRPIHFGLGALSLFSELTGTTLLEMEAMQNNMRLDSSIKLAWSGLKYAAIINNIPFDHSHHIVALWLDERPEALAEVLEIFTGQVTPTEDTSTKKKAKKTRTAKRKIKP